MATTPHYAEPYYSAYINADCKVISPLSANYHALSENCQQVNYLIDQINKPYTGNSNTERLAWLKRRRTLLMQRAAIIAKALRDLGSQDVVDHTAVDIRTISSLVASISSALPGIGTAIGLGVGIAGQVVGGLIDTTSENTAKRNEEIAYYQADLAGLQDILEQTDNEYDRLNVFNYLLWGSILVLILLLIVKKKG
jgi:hypothetical protein